MKKILLSKNRNYYKVNLHCHSTLSDGAKTPEELKKMYMEQGYSAIAYTDHSRFFEHNELTDENFIALNGFEMDINERKEGSGVKTCHICFVSLSADNLPKISARRDFYEPGDNTKYTDYIKFDENKKEYIMAYTPENLNAIMAEARNSGFYVTYNHPSWSLETLNEYGKYHGMHAMEICNYGCVEAGYTDYDDKEYDEILRGGEKIFCVATDDNHNHRNDSFGGFTMINADNLSYKDIAQALLKGDFYASQGPKINEVWYEDGKIGIECEGCASISLNTAVRRAERVYTENPNEPITSAVFDISDKKITGEYVRLTVTDFSGKHANTSAYFIADLIK